MSRSLWFALMIGIAVYLLFRYTAIQEPLPMPFVWAAGSGAMAVLGAWIVWPGLLRWLIATAALFAFVMFGSVLYVMPLVALALGIVSGLLRDAASR